MQSVVRALFDMHTCGISNAIEAIKPSSESKMGVEIAIDEWGPACIERMARIRAKLNVADNPGHQRISEAMDRLERTFLREGYQEWMRTFIPVGKPIVTHSDVQENNILLSFQCDKVYLIDYEYGTWNPCSYDLANYLNEFICDNNYPTGSGIAHFLQNWPSEDDIVSVTRQYFELENQNVVWSLDDDVC